MTEKEGIEIAIEDLCSSSDLHRCRRDSKPPNADAEWDMSTFSGWPEQQLFKGQVEIREFLDRWRAAWDEYEAGVDEFIDAGDKVCVLCWQRGRSKEAGVQVEMLAYAHVLTVREGKITRAELHSDRQKALEVAGV
jgi:ketosteroid isomerase-like protein